MSTGRYIMRGRASAGWRAASWALAGSGVGPTATEPVDGWTANTKQRNWTATEKQRYWIAGTKQRLWTIGGGE